MNIAICDDESSQRKLLSSLLKEYNEKTKIETHITNFSDGMSLIKYGKKFDVIFMDYRMKNLNGFETARRLRLSDKKCTIIFVSAYPSAVMNTFEVDVFRYLIKPINKEKLFKYLDDYRKQADRERVLTFNTRDGTVIINESDIIYCESMQKHTVIHTVNGPREICVNIKEIEKKLSAEKFFRCHKAYIVSFFHIASHTNTDIFLDDGGVAYVSRNSLTSFKTAFKEYVSKYNSEMI